MRNHRVMTYLSVLLLAVLLVACGGGGTAEETAAPDTAGEAPAAAEGAQEESAAPAGTTTIDLARFFGDCDDTTAGVTDVSQATTECEVIQILTNQFNAEQEQYQVTRLGGAEWGTYYDALNTTFAGGTPPDVAVMHGSNLPDYTARGLLLPLDDHLAAMGIDPADWTEPARRAVTYDGQIYAVPFDLHANLWHVNVDLFREAGLVDEAGNPILPTSRAEFMEQAQQIQEATGATYFATDASQFPIGVRMLFSLVWQQDSDLIDTDEMVATVDQPAAQEAVDFMLEMFDKGYANPEFNYDAAQQAFLNGEAAVLHNGTWAVDQYNREATFEYRAMDFPTLYDSPAVWANSHMWTIPAATEGADREGALAFLAYLNDHVGDWAIGTGHLAPRTSVLESEAYQEAPQRANYANTASIAVLVPAIENWQAAEDILKEELEATWLTDKPADQALADAEARINQELSR